MLGAGLDVSSLTDILREAVDFLIRASDDTNLLSGRGLDVAAHISLVLLAKPETADLSIDLQKDVVRALVKVCVSRVRLRDAQYMHRKRGRTDHITDAERALVGPLGGQRRES